MDPWRSPAPAELGEAEASPFIGEIGENSDATWPHEAAQRWADFERPFLATMENSRGLETELAMQVEEVDPVDETEPTLWLGTSEQIAFQAAGSCTPAPEPDPTGRGPHPLIDLGASRPTVGYAQQCLNEFLARYQAGTTTCTSPKADARSVVDRAIVTLRGRGQLPLGVDCRFGSSTELATKAFQACTGLKRDGRIGKDTWSLLTAFAPGGPPGPALATTFRLLLDTARDGSFAPATPTWQWGPGGRGAVVLVNNDDDGANRRPDNEDTTIDAGDDPTELAPLIIERTSPGPVAAGTQLELLVSDSRSVRIFRSSAVGATEIIGPDIGAAHRFTNLTPRRIELAMEAVRYARPTFSGEITLTLRTTSPAGVALDETSTVRVAPWIVPNHLDPAEIVYVTDAGLHNVRFRMDLRPLVIAAGCQLVEFASSTDRWMQDCMEFGYAAVPGKVLRTVLRMPRPRDLQTYPRRLLNADLGYLEEGSMALNLNSNAGGNIEATPPVTVADKRYPFGRVYFGPGRPGDEIDPDMREFLRQQIVQDPIELNTNWTVVGHVDEVVSFVPAPGAKGFKMLLPSPRRAYEILDKAVRDGYGFHRILVGRTLPLSAAAPPTAFPVERTISDFLALRADFYPELRTMVARGRVAAVVGSLRDYNNARQVDVNGIRDRLVSELGLAASDIVEIPAVFMPDPLVPRANALIAAMVNMLVLNKHCIVPKPFGPMVGRFGPMVGGVDWFEKDVREKLTPLGLTVRFLDCWHEYHIRSGEVHCATNTLRRAKVVKWWEFTP